MDTDIVNPLISHDQVSGKFVMIDGVSWYKIANCHLMPEFFMSIVSASDHWLFISSNGALTAGRKNANSALFPYYSADKIIDMAACTGPATLVWVCKHGNEKVLWEPFSSNPIRDDSRTRNLYKNDLGNRILFEEIHHDLGLCFRYSWTTGQQFGFIRRCELLNLNDDPCHVEVTDGLQNLLPSRLGKDFQLRYSNLADAYKKSELESDCGLGLYYLSSIPTDCAEPSEGLQATIAWQHGLGDVTIATSSEQLEQVRRGGKLTREVDVRGRRGSYFVASQRELEPGSRFRWSIVADVNYDHSDVIGLKDRLLKDENIGEQLDQDTAANEDQLLQILSTADGRQVGKDHLRVQRHQSNVLFNVMRGGIPACGYEINAVDFRNHVMRSNRSAYQRGEKILGEIPATIRIDQLQSLIATSGDSDLIRIASEYLPLTFSRRHGDPTRPWNEFSIDVWAEDGTPNLSYQGNWRDIFQNWEALAVAYPQFISSMVFRFVNASTADGHNPYRISKEGFDWEVPDANDPWANIGYWGDHQIIYLLRLLQWGRAMTPSRLDEILSQQNCTYADVPYRIRSAAEIVRDPQVTIDFDWERAAQIEQRVESFGSDGKLLWVDGKLPYHVGLVEKLLVPALAKLTNFVPGGGVWLNTQRPEWNDANNALVGRGLSVVTTCHLRRYLTFLIDWFESDGESIPEFAPISREVWQLAERVTQTLAKHAEAFGGTIDDHTRRQILDELASAGSDYRANLYQRGMCGEKESVTLESIVDLFRQSRTMIDHTIAANRRDDGMYHAYNLMHLSDGSAEVSHLYEMLEGQVAVLSSSVLSSGEALDVLDSLRQSKMYREDQQSYMLYPNRELPRFLDKNRMKCENAFRSKLLKLMISDANTSLARQDIRGDIHFNGNFRNASDLNAALDRLQDHHDYADLIASERGLVLELFEETFGHRNFTGRSGTFFGYEGLGSIYWHMVSKLALAVMEQCVCEREKGDASDSQVLARLLDHYHEICRGIGSTKTPSEYGAFPSDPYSHTPSGAGVQQPGMTGQVKEDILSRWAELGIRIGEGQLRFDPVFFDSAEFLSADSTLNFFDLSGDRVELPVPSGCFAFTLCQVPIIYRRGDPVGVTIHYASHEPIQRNDLTLTIGETETLFARRAEITRIEVWIQPD